MANLVDSKISEGNNNKLLNRLKEYKELITIIVFFISGFLWLYGYFATKDQLRIMKCIVNHQISMVESRIQKQDLLEQLINTIISLNDLPANDRSIDQKRACIRLTKKAEMLEENLKLVNVRYENSRHILLTQNLNIE